MSRVHESKEALGPRAHKLSVIQVRVLRLSMLQHGSMTSQWKITAHARKKYCSPRSSERSDCRTYTMRGITAGTYSG
jgi:hypothetical protein